MDRLINIPVLKGHCQTAMTCSLKNLKGCIPNKEKQRYHREGLLGVGSSALGAGTLHALNKGKDLGRLQRSPLAAAFSGHIHEKGACSACFASLTLALKQMQEQGLPLPETVCIGQGFKKKTSDELGVGDCLCGCSSFVPGCPPDPHEIFNYLKNQ